MPASLATTYPAMPLHGVPMGISRGPQDRGAEPEQCSCHSLVSPLQLGRDPPGAAAQEGLPRCSEQFQVDLSELPGTPVAPREQLGQGCLPLVCWGQGWKPQPWGYGHLEGSQAWFPMWPSCGCIAKQCPWQVITPMPAQLHPKQIRC